MTGGTLRTAPPLRLDGKGGREVRWGWHIGAVLLIVLLAVLFRVWLIDVDGVSFDSDEAVVGLMARHITQGEPVPTFFYGQDYMGSLDALLVAGGFTLFGASVDTIRVVQLVLYVLALLTAYPLAWTVTRSRRVALIALLLLAFPTALGALYTTITLGGYNELIICTNLVLLLGWQITVQGRREVWRWALLGLVTGVGWWTNAGIVTPALVVVLLGLRRGAWRDPRGVAIAALAFVIGGAPWWVYNLRHDWAALDFLTGGYEFGAEGESHTPIEALLALVLLGLPALYGLRLPWEAGFASGVGVLLVGVVYVLLVTDLIAGRRGRRHARTAPPPDIHSPSPRVERGRVPSGHVGSEVNKNLPMSARAWVWLILGVFGVVFIFSAFPDATGRYLMPLWTPAAVGIALGLERLRTRSRIAAGVALALLLVGSTGTVMRAATTDTGLTPQFVGRLRTPLQDDEALIDFLQTEGYSYGYASYWTAYRVTFRAGEDVILESTLPHEEKTEIGSGNRYTPYAEAVRQADRVVWITQNFPALDAFIVARFAAQGIAYQSRDIGLYRVYYAFDAPVAPADIGLVDGVVFESLLAQ